VSAKVQSTFGKGLWFVAPLAVSAVVPIVTLPLLTRALTPEEFGAWALAVALGSLGAALATPGLVAGFERGYFATPDQASRVRLLHSVVAYSVLALTVVGVISWTYRRSLATYFLGTESQATLLMLAFGSSAISSVKGFYLLYYRSAGDARAYALYSIDEVVIGAALSLAFVLGAGLGAVGLILGQFVAALSVLLLVATRTALRHRHGFSVAPLFEAIRVGLPLAPRVLTGTLSNQIDKYIVGAMQSTGAVGIYSLGQRLAYVPFTASNALEHMFVPRVYSLMFDRGVAASGDIGRYLTPFAYLTVGVACGVALFAEEIVWALAPQDYHAAAPVAAVLAGAYAVMFFGKLPQLVYAKKTWIASVLGVVALGLNWTFCVIGAQRWGAFGAAAGLLLTSITSGLIGFWVRQRYFPIHWEYGRLAAMFGVLALATATTVALDPDSVSYATRLSVKFAVLGLLLLVGTRCDVVTRENGRLLWSALLRRPLASQ